MIERIRVIKLTRIARFLLSIAFAITFTWTVQAPAHAETGGYPDYDATDCSSQFGIYSWCKNGIWYSSRGYGYRNCTDYVAWKLRSANDFNDTSGYGNAYEWGEKAAARGYTVNMTPKRGSVAWWGQNAGMGSWGHVAWVENVSSDGNSVTVTEYNIPGGSGAFNRRTISRSSVSGYIHFKDLSSESSEKWNGVTDAKFLGGSKLNVGDRMHGGEYILSGNVQHVLVMQEDGNLVLYGHGSSKWSSRTGGHPGANLVVQGDGNIVIYHNGKALWASDTVGKGTNRLVVQNDGNLVAYSSDGRAVWNSGTVDRRNISYRGDSELTTGQQMSEGVYLRSGDKRYALLLQNDANLVLYGPGYHVLWHSRTGGRSGAEAFLGIQSDGNIVLYNKDHVPLWNTETRSAIRFVVQTDGNLVAYASGGKPVWNSNTNGKI